MKREGSGGRGGNHLNEDLTVLAGLMVEDAGVKGVWRECGHPGCVKWFISRQGGDDFCSQSCEFSAHPEYKGSRGSKD